MDGGGRDCRWKRGRRKKRPNPGKVFVYLARLVDRRLYPAVKHLAENVASRLRGDSTSSSAFPYFYISSSIVLKVPSLHSLGRGEPPNWGLRRAGKRGEPLKGDWPTPPQAPPHLYEVTKRGTWQLAQTWDPKEAPYSWGNKQLLVGILAPQKGTVGALKQDEPKKVQIPMKNTL